MTPPLVAAGQVVVVAIVCIADRHGWLDRHPGPVFPLVQAHQHMDSCEQAENAASCCHAQSYSYIVSNTLFYTNTYVQTALIYWAHTVCWSCHYLLFIFKEIFIFYSKACVTIHPCATAWASCDSSDKHNLKYSVSSSSWRNSVSQSEI